MKTFILVLFTTIYGHCSFAENAQSLQHLIDIAYKNNPRLSASQHSLKTEEALKISRAWLEDPLVGVSDLNRGMQTQYATVSQKIKFPVKYYLQSKIQGSRTNSFKAKFEMEKLKLREQITTLYFSIYASQKIIQLTQANMQTVREFARIAEKKYAAGESPQADSMKAHFELTQLELDLIRLNQEDEAIQESLKALLNDKNFEHLDLSGVELKSPRFDATQMAQSSSQLTSTLKEYSPKIKIQTQNLKESEFESDLSKWEYAPDFQVQYQQRISGEPEDSKIFSVAMTIPLWFWKKSSESKAATSKKIAQEFQLKDTLLTTISKVKELKGKVETGAKTLNIYETSLIPQAQGTYNSTRAAYSASKTSFLDLLDSERSLYRVKTGFYQSLKQYVMYLSQLESELGFYVSDLNSKNGVKK